MISSVNYRPKYYSPGYNPVIWSVTSDQWDVNTNYDFKYVFDVFIDGSFVNRFKQRPNPSGAGMIDVSTMVDPYLEIGNFSNEVGVSVITPYKVGTDAVCTVYIKVGEEYRSGAANNPLRIYNGLVTGEEGEPEFLVGAQGFIEEEGVDEAPVIVLPMSLNWQDQQKTLQVQSTTPADYYGLFGYVAPYLMKSNAIYPAVTCGGPGLFLSKQPRNITGGAWQTSNASPSSNFTVNDLSYDRRTLSFINRNPVYEDLGGSYLQSTSPKVAWFTFYDTAGSPLGSYPILNYTGEGGAPRASCDGAIATGGTGSFSNSNNMELLSLRVGPKDLEERGLWTLLGEVPGSYTVQLYDNFAVSAGCTYSGPPTVPVSELVTINIVPDCLSDLYPRVRLAFLNELGGRDYWDFTVFAEETIDASSGEFYQNEMDWAGITPVTLSGDTSQNWMRGGTKQYNKSVRTRWTIQSDFLTQNEVDFLKNIVKSSQIWAYIGTDDFPYMCKVAETSYTVKTIKMVKMFTATFNIELSTAQTMQNP